MERGLDQTPSVPGESHDRNFSIAQILLMSKVSIRRKQKVESRLLRHAQQFSVKQRTPSLLTRRLDDMVSKRIPYANRRSLVK
jgi:hypothetical protein